VNSRGPFGGHITNHCTCKRKDKNVVGGHELVFESPLRKSNVLMLISLNQSKIRNGSHDEFNVKSINSDVASPQRHFRFLTESIPRRMRPVAHFQGF
jgi:hypothetical protein